MISTGWRATARYSGGSTTAGMWHCARPHQDDLVDLGRALSPGQPFLRWQARDLGRRGFGSCYRRGGDEVALARRQAAAGIGRATVALLGDRQDRAAGRSADRAASLSARGTRLAAIPAGLRAWWHPRRRYGARKDRGGARPRPGRKARRPARPAVPRGLPDECGAELARRSRTPSTRVAGAVIARARSRATFWRDRRGRSGADDLCIVAARRRPSTTGSLAHRGARRGAGDQERQCENHRARLPARRAAPAVPDRNAGRKPSRRALVAIRLSDAGAARRCPAFWPRLPYPDREEAGWRAPRGAFRQG